MTISLNTGQEEAAEAFFRFLFSEEKEFIISGPGGTGKTHLMSALIDQIMPRYFDSCKLLGIKPEYETVEMTATTNKAAEVLAKATKRPTSTIHSFLNLKVTEDYGTGQTKLAKTTAWKVHEKLILFIDECSMIDTPLRNVILEGTHNCKIVYVGDHCQLAPIAEPISPIYRLNVPFCVLTEQMRTTVPELQAINDQLRETVETGVFKPIQVQPGVIDWLDDAQMEALIDSEFLSQEHSNRILAYTNNRVNQYNDHIREVRQLPPAYTEGERLISGSAIRIGKSMLSVEQEVLIHDQANTTTKVFLDKDAELEVRETTLKTSIGSLIHGVRVPEDRDHFLALIKYFQRKKDWPSYFKLKNEFPDLRPADASTVHKAQGSTYDTSFIDLGNISTCHNADQAARMLYVAFSRARKRVVLYGDLAPKYGGLIH